MSIYLWFGLYTDSVAKIDICPLRKGKRDVDWKSREKEMTQFPFRIIFGTALGTFIRLLPFFHPFFELKQTV